MKISNRLMEIVNFVPKNSIVADIGTDHGQIPIYLILNKLSKKVIATDISRGSLQKTIDYVAGLKLENHIESRLGDGLDPIKPFEIDTVIMAGMGGILIRDILEKNKEVRDSINNFIFQPMIASKELREYLLNNHFEIIDEGLVKEDNKFYEIIYAKRGLGFIEEDIHLEIGRKLIDKNHPLLGEFLQYKIDVGKSIMAKLGDTVTEKTEERRKELEKSIEEYKEVLGKIESQ